MKKIWLFLLLFAPILAAPAGADANNNYVLGGFEASGHVVAGAGYEHFSNDAVTEWTNDGTFPGVIGSYIPNVAAGVAPSPGQDNLMFYVDDVELDIIKSFGENIRLRADLEFGRLASGSFWNFNLQQAYVTANIPVGNGIEVLIGHFWGPAGFEEDDAYDNEIISWSILSRANLYPYILTGAKILYAFNDLVELHVFVVNGLTNDTTAKINDMPSFGASLRFNWGEEDSESTVGISPFFGPESNSNRHYTFGADIDWMVYVTDAFAIGGEGLFRQDNGFGGPNSRYLGGLFELYYDFTDSLYGVLRYTYAQQFQNTNGVLNLTGQKQQIHEASLAGGFWITDATVIKVEARFDFIDPAGASNQTNIGGALAMAYGF
ncbi:MAG: outer membrane beta-barrel protein [Pseudomonadota bacterium]